MSAPRWLADCLKGSTVKKLTLPLLLTLALGAGLAQAQMDRTAMGAGHGHDPAHMQARIERHAADLKERLTGVVEDAVAVLEKVGAEALAGRVTIQNYDITRLEAVFHSVQHFAQHTGQIVFITKNLTCEDLGFYKHLSRPAHGEKTP